MAISGLFLQDYLNLELTSEEVPDDEVFEPQADPTVMRRICHVRRSDSQYHSMSSGRSITPPCENQRGLRQATQNEEVTDEELSLSGSHGIGDRCVCHGLTFLDGGSIWSMQAVSSQKSVDSADSDPDVEPELEPLDTDGEDDIVFFPSLSAPERGAYSCHGNTHARMDTVTPEKQYSEAVPNRELIVTYRRSPIAGESYTCNRPFSSIAELEQSSNEIRDGSYSHNLMNRLPVECEQTQKFSGSMSPQ